MGTPQAPKNPPNLRSDEGPLDAVSLGTPSTNNPKLTNRLTVAPYTMMFGYHGSGNAIAAGVEPAHGLLCSVQARKCHSTKVEGRSTLTGRKKKGGL